MTETRYYCCAWLVMRLTSFYFDYLRRQGHAMLADAAARYILKSQYARSAQRYYKTYFRLRAAGGWSQELDEIADVCVVAVGFTWYPYLSMSSCANMPGKLAHIVRRLCPAGCQTDSRALDALLGGARDNLLPNDSGSDECILPPEMLDALARKVVECAELPQRPPHCRMWPWLSFWTNCDSVPEPLLAACGQDDGGGLILADWLEEQGDDRRAELLRLACVADTLDYTTFDKICKHTWLHMFARSKDAAYAEDLPMSI